MEITAEHSKRQRGFAGQNVRKRLLLDGIGLQRVHVPKRDAQLPSRVEPHLANPAPSLADQATMPAGKTAHGVLGLPRVEFSHPGQSIQNFTHSAHIAFSFSLPTFNLPTSIIYLMFSLAVQAGGMSERMGEDKALKPFLGRPLILRVIDRLASLSDEILVTTNRPEDYAFLHLRLVADLVPGRGPLGGLYTALASATFPIAAVVACDMPFASARLLETAARLLVEEEADMVIAKTGDGYEPFHAVYRCAACLPAIQSAVDAGRLKVTGWFSSVKVRELTPAEVAEADPTGHAFWNVNTPEEFAEAERLSLTLPGRGPR